MKLEKGLNTSIDFLERLITDHFIANNRSAPFFPGNLTKNQGTTSDAQNMVFFGDLLSGIANIINAPRTKPLFLWSLSSRFRKVANQQLGIPLENIGLINRNDFLRGVLKKNLPKPGDKWTLVYAGRISYSKGIEEFLYCAHELQTIFGENLDVRIYGVFNTQSLSDLQIDYVNDIEQRVGHIINLPTWKSRPSITLGLSPDEWITHEELVNPFLLSSSHYFFDDFNVSALQALNANWGLIALDWGGLHDYTNVANLIPSSLNFVFNHNDQRREWYLRAIGHYLASQIHQRHFITSTDTFKEIVPKPITLKELRSNVEGRLNENNLVINHLTKPVEDWHERDENFFLTCYRMILAGECSNRQVIPVISSQYKYTWHSMNEILPAIKDFWLRKSDAQHDFILVNEFPFNRDRRLIIKLSQFLGIKPILINVRAEKTTAPLIFFLKTICSGMLRQITYLHEAGAWAGINWLTFRKSLDFTQGDLFVATCEGDRANFKLAFPKADVTIRQFPLAKPLVQKVCGSSQKIIYTGRISEQKNIHLLVLALSIAAKLSKKIPEIHIYGTSDALGTPLCGIESRNYHGFLETLIKTLKVDNLIFFHGHVEREYLHNTVLSEPHTFISLSLHHDENFGAAAFQSLRRDRAAILSAWGGHLEHLKNAPKLVTPIPVIESRWGPSLNMSALVDSLITSNETPGTLKIDTSDGDFDSLNNNFNPIPLAESNFFRELEIQALKFPNSNDPIKQQIFHNFEDPLAHQLWRNYGMSSLEIKIGKRLVPWATLEENELIIRDPHKGKIVIKITLGKHAISNWSQDESAHIDLKLARELSNAGWLI